MVYDIRLQKYLNRNGSLWRVFSDNLKTVEKEDDITAVLNCMHLMLLQSKYGITGHLLNHCFIELSLFTLNNCFVLCSMDFLKL